MWCEVRGNFTPTCPGFAGTSSPLVGEEKEEKDVELSSFSLEEDFLFPSPLREKLIPSPFPLEGGR
ncbi:MAG: hypothetical protein DRQ04_03085 [Candidatus Hydrothermota bacterium]|nr:MAG: hypothetical protein DRQ04_03085 [Candidatus Hydrothermae bacterium]